MKSKDPRIVFMRKQQKEWASRGLDPKRVDYLNNLAFDAMGQRPLRHRKQNITTPRNLIEGKSPYGSVTTSQRKSMDIKNKNESVEPINKAADTSNVQLQKPSEMEVRINELKADIIKYKTLHEKTARELEMLRNSISDLEERMQLIGRNDYECVDESGKQVTFSFEQSKKRMSNLPNRTKSTAYFKEVKSKYGHTMPNLNGISRSRFETKKNTLGSAESDNSANDPESHAILNSSGIDSADEEDNEILFCYWIAVFLATDFFKIWNNRNPTQSSMMTAYELNCKRLTIQSFLSTKKQDCIKAKAKNYCASKKLKY